MNIKSTSLLFLIVSLLSLSAAAKQPVTGGCSILVAPTVNANTPFTVTVAKSPTYPGQWVAPSVTVEMTVPVDATIMPGPNSYSQTVHQTIDGLGGSGDAEAVFVIPAFANLLFQDVGIIATVTEPLNKTRRFEAPGSENNYL
jgi:hypothetical protein